MSPMTNEWLPKDIFCKKYKLFQKDKPTYEEIIDHTPFLVFNKVFKQFYGPFLED